jgi:hypothetical protein
MVDVPEVGTTVDQEFDHTVDNPVSRIGIHYVSGCTG